MSQTDGPSDLAGCSCSAQDLLKFLRIVVLRLTKLETFKFRELCQSKKIRTELLQEHSFCMQCNCGVCHPVPLLAISPEHQVILLRLPPTLNTTLTSTTRTNAQSRKQVLGAIYDQLNLTTYNGFSNGVFENYYWYTHYEAACPACRMLEAPLAINVAREVFAKALEPILGSPRETPEKLFEGVPTAHIYQSLTLRAILNRILELSPRSRQVVIARLKQAQAKNKHVSVMPILQQIVNRAFFDDRQEAQQKYELFRNYGMDTAKGIYRLPIHDGDMPELQIALQLDQPATTYKLGNGAVLEHFPQDILCLTLYYEALVRAKKLQHGATLSTRLKQHQAYFEGLFWDWDAGERKGYLKRIQNLLTTFKDQIQPIRKHSAGLVTVKEAKFKVSEDLLDLADSLDLHQILGEAIELFFQTNRPGQRMLIYLASDPESFTEA